MLKKGYKQTKQHSRKIGLDKDGKYYPKLFEAQIGRIQTLKTRNKIRTTLKRKYQLGLIVNPMKGKLSGIWKFCETCNVKFYTTPKDSKRRFCSMKCYDKMGKKNPFYKKTHTLENKKIIGEKSSKFWTGRKHPRVLGQTENQRMSVIRNQSLAGKNNPNWQNWKSREPYSFEFDKNLKSSIHIRDLFHCQLCGKLSQCIHHIDYDKQNNDKINLVALCFSCNSKCNFNREFWTNYFQNRQFLITSLHSKNLVFSN